MYPVLKKTDLGGLSVSDPQGAGGNPYHDSSGKFTFAPPGLKILTGRNLAKGMDPNTRKLMFKRSDFLGANQAAFKKLDDGTIVAVFTRDGKLLDSVSIAPPPIKEGVQGKAPPSVAENRDLILRLARDTNISEDKLKKRIEEELGPLGPQVADVYVKAIIDQRLEDLVEYLHQNLYKKLKGKVDNKVRISTPRGYLRKTLAGLKEKDVNFILTKLQGRGWSESILQKYVVKQFPERLRKNVENKGKINENEGKDSAGKGKAV